MALQRRTFQGLHSGFFPQIKSKTCTVKRNIDVEATIVGKFVVMAPLLDERARRLWAAAESVAIGYGGDALVSAATGLARETIRHGRRELAQGVEAPRADSASRSRASRH